MGREAAVKWVWRWWVRRTMAALEWQYRFLLGGRGGGDVSGERFGAWDWGFGGGFSNGLGKRGGKDSRL